MTEFLFFRIILSACAKRGRAKHGLVRKNIFIFVWCAGQKWAIFKICTDIARRAKLILVRIAMTILWMIQNHSVLCPRPIFPQ